MKFILVMNLKIMIFLINTSSLTFKTKEETIDLLNTYKTKLNSSLENINNTIGIL